MYAILYLDFCGGTPRIEFQYSQKINVPFIVLKRVLKWSILTSIEMQPRNMSDYVAPPSNNFWIHFRVDFLRDRNKIGSIDFQLISIYCQFASNWFSIDCQLISIYCQFTSNWFSIDFNWFSIDFNLLSIYFKLIFNWFQLISTYFQLIFNWFQFTINWFQFTFNWFSIDVNLLSIDLQLISIWSEIILNWISTCFQLTFHSNPIEIS